MAPTSIEIVGYSAGQRVDIKENEELELTCKVANAKPKANIVWYRNNARFTVCKYHSIVLNFRSFDPSFIHLREFFVTASDDSEEDGSISGEDRKTAVSKISFRPTSRDNKAIVACEAEHPAVNSAPMRVGVVLSVQCE